MVEIKLPCEIGMKTRDKDDGSEWRIVGYEIIGNGNSLSPSHRVMAQAIDVYDEDNQVLISSHNGMFPDSIEILGY